MHLQFKLIFLLLGVFYALNVHNVNAQTIYANSCSQTDVQSAIANASDGDTVIVPSGTCTWSSTAENLPSVSITQDITLQGAGIDQTTIIDDTGTLSRQDPLQLAASYGARVTGFTFTRLNTNKDAGCFVSPSGTLWRVDNNKFYQQNILKGIRGIKARGTGLIDNNIFINTGQGVSCWYDGTNDGSVSWELPLSLGTADAIYVEDNTFEYTEKNDGALDAYGGARYVFRYNTVNNTNIGHHGFDSSYGAHSFEVYGNTFNADLDSSARAYTIRGGTGVYFNNTYTGDYGDPQVTYYRSALVYHGDMCDGTSAWDGNVEANGYPCKDQPGRTCDCDDDDIQDLSPIYSWNNTLNGVPLDISIFSNFGTKYDDRVYLHLQEGRDFYNNTQKPGYTPYQYPHPLRTTGDEAPAAPTDLHYK